MWLTTFRNWVLGPRSPRPPVRQRRPAQLRLEQLEDRALPSAYTAATVSDLIADFVATNHHGGANTITLAANTAFVLTAVDNTRDGATGLPVIKAGNDLTLVGNGDTIERSTASGIPDFRLLAVDGGGSLTAANLTLQNGLAFGAGAAAEGGAIYNQGTLVLDGLTVQANTAQGKIGKATTKSGSTGGPGEDAAGGGIWSGGTLTLQNGTTVQNNEALGGRGGQSMNGQGGPGGNGFGGGVYVAGGTVNLTSAVLSNNTALGGGGGSTDCCPGAGGDGQGGGLYVAGGTVSLRTDMVTSNTAQEGFGLGPSASYGGGMYIAAGATVYLDAFTLAHTSNNTANIDPDISGSYILLS
jgi:hypothetical protein